jgi:hypothetical protein
LEPDLPTFPDHYSFGIGMGKVRLEYFHNIYLLLVKHQLVLSLV